jgi:acetyltransferase-like isoleucine patch superfamily enzyme
MYTPEYMVLYSRYLAQRARHPQVAMGGMVFFGRRVALKARVGHGNLELGAWCWIGDDNKLRAHEGNLRLGPKVVMGRDNVINTYLDIEIGTNALLGDWIYICDFDHVYERLDIPIKAQGLVKSPVRVGADVWVGEKASILRGADVGSGEGRHPAVLHRRGHTRPGHPQSPAAGHDGRGRAGAAARRTPHPRRSSGRLSGGGAAAALKAGEGEAASAAVPGRGCGGG